MKTFNRTCRVCGKSWTSEMGDNVTLIDRIEIGDGVDIRDVTQELPCGNSDDICDECFNEWAGKASN